MACTGIGQLEAFASQMGGSLLDYANGGAAIPIVDELIRVGEVKSGRQAGDFGFRTG